MTDETTFSVYNCRIEKCGEPSINCKYCAQHYELYITPYFTEFIKYLSTKSMRTTERYIYHLSWIGIQKLNNIKTKNDLHKLYIWMTQQTGRQTYNFIKNYKIVYSALKQWLMFKNRYELLDFIIKPDKKTDKRAEKLKHHDRNTINLFITHSDKKIKYKTKQIIDKDEYDADRDKTFLMFLADTGARVGEAVSTSINDVDFKKEEIFLSEYGKTGERTILISERLTKQLKIFTKKYKIKSYLFDFKPSINKKKSEVWGNYASTDTNIKKNVRKYKFYRQIQKAEYMIKSLGKTIKMINVITPHQFRHSLAMFFHKDKKWSIENVQVMLGHQDLKTTQIYAKTTIKDIKEDYRRDLKEKH